MLKRFSIISSLLITLMLVFAACGNTEEDVSSTSEASEQQSSDSDDSDDESTGGSSSIETEDQLGLGIGDTGKLESTIGTYEVTLNDVEIIGKEFEGEVTELDTYISLDITVKNTSNEPLEIEDMIYSFEITEDLEMSGYSDLSEYFDLEDKLVGTLGPGEEASGTFFSDTYEGDIYYFGESSAPAKMGLTNQVTWEIPAEDVE